MVAVDVTWRGRFVVDNLGDAVGQPIRCPVADLSPGVAEAALFGKVER